MSWLPTVSRRSLFLLSWGPPFLAGLIAVLVAVQIRRYKVEIAILKIQLAECGCVQPGARR